MEERTCIWCCKGTADTEFISAAHIIPKSLGGTEICENVCDSCNRYFGTNLSGKFAVELVLKELFNLSRYSINSDTGNIGRGKRMARLKSSFFSVNEKKGLISLKTKYKVEKKINEKFIVRQLKRGIYKIFLEAYEKEIGNALDDNFNFIRHFSRYDWDDYPLFYFVPKHNFLALSIKDIDKPKLRFSENVKEKMNEYRFYNFFFFGHYFAIPIISKFELTIDLYIKNLSSDMINTYKEIRQVEKIGDIDFLHSYVSDK